LLSADRLLERITLDVLQEGKWKGTSGGISLPAGCDMVCTSSSFVAHRDGVAPE
jgi:hypothetical protein